MMKGRISKTMRRVMNDTNGAEQLREFINSGAKSATIEVDGIQYFISSVPIRDREVKPKRVDGWSVSWNLNLFTGPRLYIECGACGVGFKYRVPLVSYPKVRCSCGAINKLLLEYGRD